MQLCFWNVQISLCLFYSSALNVCGRGVGNSFVAALLRFNPKLYYIKLLLRTVVRGLEIDVILFI